MSSIVGQCCWPRSRRLWGQVQGLVKPTISSHIFLCIGAVHADKPIIISVLMPWSRLARRRSSVSFVSLLSLGLLTRFVTAPCLIHEEQSWFSMECSEVPAHRANAASCLLEWVSRRRQEGPSDTCTHCGGLPFCVIGTCDWPWHPTLIQSPSLLMGDVRHWPRWICVSLFRMSLPFGSTSPPGG
ncbi:uncharacterized protein BJX67DRAFT_262088 [Aspergillus lucknowensis]|uniref:Uncharacterized protein n=1 Tax=Aspergillus lucknowensis TaxID=176173 RepID=A0ABR4LG64_9EURO